MQSSSARLGSVLQGGLARRQGPQPRGRPTTRPQAQAGMVRQSGGVLDAVIQGYVSDGLITREEAATMSPEQLQFLIRKRTRSDSPPPPAARHTAAPPQAAASGQMSIQAYVNDGTITAEEAATMSSTQLEFLIRKRTRSGSPVPAPGASSAVPYRPGQRSSSAPQQPIASTPVAGGLGGGMGVNEAELSPEQLELLQEYIRIKEQEEMLQQQEALLQQQVASLRTEVEELEGSAGAKAQQSQSVFRDAPPLRDAAPGAARGQQQKKEQQQAGAAGAAAAGEGSSPKGWVAAAAGAVALAGLSAGIYFAPENLFKPKESATGVQQPAPATAALESARLVDRPSDEQAAADAQAAAEAKAAAKGKVAEEAKAAELKAAAEAKAADEARKAAQARAADEARKAAEAKVAADAKAAAEARAAELKAEAEAKAAAQAKAAAEARVLEESRKAAEARAAELKASAEAKAMEEARKAAAVKAAAEAKSAAEEREEVKLAAELAKGVGAPTSAAPAQSSSPAAAAKVGAFRGFFGQRAAPADAVSGTSDSKDAVAPLAMSAEAEALKSKLRGEAAPEAAPSPEKGIFQFGRGAEVGALAAAGTAIAAALAVRSGNRAPAQLIRTAETRVTTLKETLEAQQADLKAAQERVVAAQAEYAKGLASLRAASSELQSLSSRVLSSEKAANALVADLEKLNIKDNKDAARLRSEAASIASQVAKQRELVSAQVAKQRQVVEAALQKALAEVSA